MFGCQRQNGNSEIHAVIVSAYKCTEVPVPFVSHETGKNLTPVPRTSVRGINRCIHTARAHIQTYIIYVCM